MKNIVMSNEYKAGMERGIDLAVELLYMSDEELQEIFNEPDAICVLEAFTGKEIISRLRG